MSLHLFSGSGSAEVLAEKQLAELNGQTLFLAPGSGATLNVEANTLKEVGGNIVLSMRDDSEYVVVQLDGSFDASTGFFNGKGGATVTREKLLFGEMGASYSFWLQPGSGAEGTIVDNALTEVGGNVPFMVQDEVGVLIEGAAEGKYLTESGLFTGSGSVYLGRDIDYEIGSDTLLRFKQGSGGMGEVVDSELRRLGGTLSLELWVEGEPLVSIEGSGEYDAVASELLWAEGSATLLKPWELLGGEIIVEGVTGTARVENGELVRAGGEGTLHVPSSIVSVPSRWTGAQRVDEISTRVREPSTSLSSTTRPRVEKPGNNRCSIQRGQHLPCGGWSPLPDEPDDWWGTRSRSRWR